MGFGGDGGYGAQSAAQAELSYKISKEQLDFQKAQYDDWKSIYGPLQEDLGTYFKNLTGDAMAAKQITEIQAGAQAAQQQVDQQLAQRGISGSGLEASLLQSNAFSTEMAKANVRANADTMAAQQQMGFLGLGLGQGNSMLSNIANTANSAAANQANMSNASLSAATSIQNANTALAGDIFGAVTGGATTYFTSK